MSNPSYRFVGIVCAVARGGSQGRIAKESIRRPDGEELGLTVSEDVLLFSDSFKKTTRLHAGMHVSFLIGPEPGVSGKLLANRARVVGQD